MAFESEMCVQYLERPVLMLDNEGMNNPAALKWTELFLFPLSTEKPHRGEIVAFLHR